MNSLTPLVSYYNSAVFAIHLLLSKGVMIQILFPCCFPEEWVNVFFNCYFHLIILLNAAIYISAPGGQLKDYNIEIIKIVTFC